MGPTDDVSEALHKSGDKMLMLMQDALGVNQLIEGKLANWAVRSWGTEHEFSMLRFTCCAHGVVLCMRPAFARVLGPATNLVRLGHLCESQRFYRMMDIEIDRLARQVEPRTVGILPDAVRAWKATAKALFLLTRPAKDFDAGAVDFIILIINNGPNDTTLAHYHSLDCPCGGLEHFPDKFKRAFMLIIGNGCFVALLYRWKKFESVSSNFYRGIKCHGVLRQTLIGMYSEKDVHRVQDDAAAAAARGDVSHAANGVVRAGTVINYITLDTTCRGLHQPILICKPLQHYIIARLAAEKASRAFIAELVSVPATPEVGRSVSSSYQKRKRLRGTTLTSSIEHGRLQCRLDCLHISLIWMMVQCGVQIIGRAGLSVSRLPNMCFAVWLTLASAWIPTSTQPNARSSQGAPMHLTQTISRTWLIQFSNSAKLVMDASTKRSIVIVSISCGLCTNSGHMRRWSQRFPSSQCVAL